MEKNTKPAIGTQECAVAQREVEKVIDEKLTKLKSLKLLGIDEDGNYCFRAVKYRGYDNRITYPQTECLRGLQNVHYHANSRLYELNRFNASFLITLAKEYGIDILLT